MKKLFLALTVLGSVIASSLTAFGYEDRRDHDWTDDYWHHHHYGYWHGERGYWRYHDHKHEFIRVGPDWSGLRTTLANKGITFNAQYTAQVWGNPIGGESTGTVYTGLMSFQGNVDLQKLLGWQGGTVSTRWYWLSGQDISAEHVGNVFTVSTIAGYPTVRANELWFQQNFLNDRISIRLGQLGADSEFDLSTYSAVFLNGTFSWSPYLSTNIPNGGPGYPMGAPGVRLALTPLDWVTYQGAAFQGNVFAQNVNRHGFRWDLNSSNGYFPIHELMFRTNQGAGVGGLPGEIKVGGWFDTVPDQKAAASQPWNYGFYFVADQALYRVPQPVSAPAVDDNGKQTPAVPSTEKDLGMFTHIAFAPRNSSLMNFYIDGGLNYKGLFPTRDNDVLGVAFAYGHLTNNPQENDGGSFPGYEMVLEATYQMEITPWLTVQPDVQYVIHPSGADIGNALVSGAQATVSF